MSGDTTCTEWKAVLSPEAGTRATQSICAGEARGPVAPGTGAGGWVCRLWKEGRKGAQEDHESLAWLNGVDAHLRCPPASPQCCCIQAILPGRATARTQVSVLLVSQDPRVTPILKITDPRDSEDLKLHPSPGQDISRDRVSLCPLADTPQWALDRQSQHCVPQEPPSILEVLGSIPRSSGLSVSPMAPSQGWEDTV